MRVAIIGIGLIGGSLAIGLREKRMATRVTGVDSNREHQQKALQLGLVDEIKDLNEAVENSDLVILAVPVDACLTLLPYVLDRTEKQIVIDTGSTKKALIDKVALHPKRNRYVATHPMWGTEYSGPEAAQKTAFTDKAVVICDKEKSDADAVQVIVRMYKKLGMHVLYMESEAHDVHTAYVSHISHITSFALANTVLEKEKEEDAIFELASGGFESTVRLAKSNPSMWVPIFRQNRENVLDVLNEHISQLRKFKACLEKENYEYLQELIVHANEIKRVLNR
jgi:prephenate dehydrogenase